MNASDIINIASKSVPQVRVANYAFKGVVNVFILISLIMGCIMLNYMSNSSSNIIEKFIYILVLLSTLIIPFLSIDGIIPYINTNKNIMLFYVFYVVLSFIAMKASSNVLSNLNVNSSSSVISSAKNVKNTTTGIFVISIILLCFHFPEYKINSVIGL